MSGCPVWTENRVAVIASCRPTHVKQNARNHHAQRCPVRNPNTDTTLTATAAATMLTPPTEPISSTQADASAPAFDRLAYEKSKLPIPTHHADPARTMPTHVTSKTKSPATKGTKPAMKVNRQPGTGMDVMSGVVSCPMRSSTGLLVVIGFPFRLCVGRFCSCRLPIRLRRERDRWVGCQRP